jgi:hypothetical protein
MIRRPLTPAFRQAARDIVLGLDQYLHRELAAADARYEAAKRQNELDRQAAEKEWTRLKLGRRMK